MYATEVLKQTYFFQFFGLYKYCSSLMHSKKDTCNFIFMGKLPLPIFEGVGGHLIKLVHTCVYHTHMKMYIIQFILNVQRLSG